MEFGFYLPTNGPTAQPDDLAEIARHGDRLGYHSMVVGDHVLVPKQIDSPYPYTVSGEFPGGETGEYLEQSSVPVLVPRGRQTMLPYRVIFSHFIPIQRMACFRGKPVSILSH